MSVTFECGDNTTLVSYLYDECEPAEREAVAAHVRTCPACTAELEALSSTRLLLATWTPPDARMAFRVVSDTPVSTVLRPARWWKRPLPVWAQAAAAVALFGIGLGFGVMQGERSNAPPASTAVASALGAQVQEVTATDLQALEERLRSEMSAIRLVAETPAPEAAPAVPADAEARVLARVRALIEESEMRQRRELALRTAEVVRDIDAQRQSDWARVQRTLGQFEGTTGAEIQRQRQELNNLIRVSQRPQ